MKKTSKLTQTQEQKILTKCIFKGLTIAQIAHILNYSQSTISYRIKVLFKKYNVKGRVEFILRVFSDVIERYDKQIENFEKEVENLKLEIEKLKNN